MVGKQTVFSILDEAAAAIGGWTALEFYQVRTFGIRGAGLGTVASL